MLPGLGALHRPIGRLIGLGLCFVAGSQFSYAQSDSVLQQQQQIIQEQQQRLEDQRKKLDQSRHHQNIEIENPNSFSQAEGGPCFDINHIVLRGADHLPAKDQRQISQPFIGQCIDLAKINQLLKHISDWYFERGYVTSRAYVSAQDLASGNLEITVVEGIIESVDLANPEAKVNLKTAFGQFSGRLLNLRDIEQGLEQINRLQSNQAKMDLVPGSKPGQTTIQVKVEQGKTWQSRLSRDNSGSESTGKYMNGLLLSNDNSLNLNDYAYLSLQKDSEPSGAGKLSESIAGHWDMPFGYWLLGVDVSYYKYLNTINNFAGQFESSGNGSSQKLFAQKTLFRNQTSKWKAKLQLERKNSRNYIENVKLASSRSLGIASINLSFDTVSADKSQWLAAVQYDRGLKSFGAPNDNVRSHQQAPKAQFNKLSLNLDWHKKTSIKLYQTDIPVVLSSGLKLQHSPDILFGSEQISVGSQYTVRGYKGSSIAASSGGYWRNDLSLELATPWAGDYLKKIIPSVSLDMGAVRDRQHFYGAGEYVQLKGWSLGLALHSQYYSLNIIYAEPFGHPSWMQLEPQQWHISLNINY